MKLSETWAELYSAVKEFHALAPWRWMLDREVFGVRDPATGEIGWCGVLGAGGQLSGLFVYRGDTGFDAYRRLQQGETLRDEAAFGQDALVLAFVDRADMPQTDLQRLRALGLTFRGAGRWPQLESHARGRLPIPIREAEAERMLHTLRQAIEVAQALRDAPGWIEPDSQGRLRVQTLRDGAWDVERVAPPAPIQEPVPQFDAVRAARLKRSLQPSRAVLECDLCSLPMVIEEQKDHPYVPAHLFLVDAESGAILHQHLCPPEERHPMAQIELMNGLERLGIAPASVLVKRPSLARVLAPLGTALGVELRVVDELPAVEEALAAAEEFFLRGPGSRGRG